MTGCGIQISVCSGGPLGMSGSRYTLHMAKKPARRPSGSDGRRRKVRYTAGEWFMVALGVALIILVVGMVVSSVLGK
jgi:hypothetical protein